MATCDPLPSTLSPADHEALMTFRRAKDDIQSDSETKQNRCQQQPMCPSQPASSIVGVRCSAPSKSNAIWCLRSQSLTCQVVTPSGRGQARVLSPSATVS
jgi:hypothetical protein